MIQRVLCLFVIVTSGIFGFAAGAGLTSSIIVAAITAVLFAVAAFVVLKNFPILEIEKTACSRGLLVLSGIAIIAALVLLARLTVFMISPEQTQYSTVPSSDWEVRHNCFSAYYVAAQSSRTVPDIYANSLYSSPDDNPASPRKPLMIGPFRVDVYEYPPPFLVLPRALNFVSSDFLRERLLWFALNGLVILIAMLYVARSLGPAIGTRALLLMPLVWAALPFLSTMQKGNVQMMIVALSMTAMVVFARERFALGGALLAYSTASKLYPGMLIVYLIARRKWRAVAFTAAFGLLLAALTIPVAGLQTYPAFLTHLPKILSGEAFPAFRNPPAMAINYSVPGIIFKLKLFGVSGMGFAASKIVGWIYTLILLTIIFLISRRIPAASDSPLVWMAILLLATLRSPFLPQTYASFPPLWLLTLLGATYAPNAKNLAVLILVLLILNVMIPVDLGIGPRGLAIITSFPQLATLALGLIGLREWARTTMPAPGNGQISAAPQLAPIH